MDLFCSGITKNPTRKSWIFSFVPTDTTSFVCLLAKSFDRQVNIIAALGGFSVGFRMKM
jgi:hypothetical protein